MIKKLCILLAVVFYLGAKGQTNVYHPFPTIYGDWGGVETIYPTSGCNPCGTQEFKFIYYTSGDTIINTLNYKKVNYINDGLFMGVLTPLNQIFTGGTYNFAYRNDSLHKKVYIVPNDSAHEKLWYDFNLNVGDTLKGTYSTGMPPYYTSPGIMLKVDSIDSMLVCGNYRKSFVCTCGGSGSPFSKEYLIEGMGFSTNFISTYLSDICAFEPVVMYGTNAWSLDACPHGLGIKNNTTATSTIKIYPNPAKDLLYIESSTINETAQITLTDMLGNKVKQITFNEPHLSFNITDLNEGVYNIGISSSEGVINKRLVIVK